MGGDGGPGDQEGVLNPVGDPGIAIAVCAMGCARRVGPREAGWCRGWETRRGVA